MGRVQKLKKSPLSAKNYLRSLEAERRTLRAEQLQLLGICKSPKRQVAVLVEEPRAGQAELADLTSHFHGVSGGVIALKEERDAATPLEATRIEILKAAEITRDAISRDITSARRRTNLT